MRKQFLDSDSDAYFTNLIERMQIEYNDDKNIEQICFDPVEGMPLAALYNKLWHRAEVISVLPNLAEIDVYFVDFGNIYTVSIFDTRYLSKEFIKLIYFLLTLLNLNQDF